MDDEIGFGPPTTARMSPNGRWVVSPGDFFIKMLEGRPVYDQLVIATCAIFNDPGCIEARLVMAAYSKDLATELRHLEAAVAAGEWLWSQVSDDPEVDLCWWGDVGTRPYMRALHSYGLALREAGREDEAQACFKRLLGMNPHDNQGIRYLMGQQASPRPR